MPSRRRILAACGGAVGTPLTGCLSPFGSSCVHSANFDMTTASTSSIVDAYATRLSELGPLDRQLATATVADESPTITIAEERPELRMLDTPVVVDGQIYAFTSRLTATTTRPGYQVRFDANESVQTAADSSDTIAYEDLPEVDKRVVLYAVLNDLVAKTRNADVDVGRIQFETTRTLVYPSDDAEADSLLVPRPEHKYLTYGDLTIRLTAVATDADVAARTFAIQAEQVAESKSAFVASKRDSHGVDIAPSSLSAEQTDIIDTAIDEEYGYTTCIDKTPTAAFRDLMTTIFEFEGNLRTGPSEQPRLVHYEDTWYLGTYTVAVR